MEEWVTISCGKSRLNALMTSHVISFIICSIRLIGNFECCRALEPCITNTQFSEVKHTWRGWGGRWRKPWYMEKTTDLSQFTDKLYNIMLYQVHFGVVGFELTMLVVIGTDCIGSYESNYQTITTTTTPTWRDRGVGGFVYTTTFCACPMTGPRFLMPYICLGYFCIQCVKMRGDCSLHWYWWNCWPSLFLTFFPINLSNNCHLWNISFFHYIWLRWEQKSL